MTIDKQKLKALAGAATQSHGARRVEVERHGVHVIGDGSWKILSAWHTPDGKGAQNAEFAAAASPATILALLAEIERLEQYAELEAKGSDAAAQDLIRLVRENRQLKAENEALRKDAERYRAIRDEIPHADLGRAILDVQTADEYDAAVDAAMAKEAAHD
ncbi:ead/Ea22-like family protein [Pseudomonas sp. GD03746]|uniref:ead/Ea22-like family protein n=1 Tax=Pseudomonas sp. GD03746 TaxID=2975378 RepID=UPI00244A8126|nr:ead/Ea22-like family protein [Pseudomonas sp. GD03746]MDH1575499.1 ead/Ea22-like family protein [Pseudomonas sp. GD03746]